MSKPSSVFFTGMEALDAEQLTALFMDINRRSGNRWSLAADADSADMLVIDVDTLYGHMAWLRATNAGQIVVALTTNESAEADHVLQRPVKPAAMRRVFNIVAGDGASSGDSALDAPETDSDTAAKTVSVVEPPEAEAAPAATPPAGLISDELPARPHAEAPTATEPMAKPVASATGERKLVDRLLDGSIGSGPQKLELPNQPPLVLDMTKKQFLCGNSIKRFLPYTQADWQDSDFTPVSDTEFEALTQDIGEAKPLARLLWLAALGGSNGEIPGSTPDTRYRLTKWPQIEREFPRHFRIATAMMKGFHTVDELAEQSGASATDVNDFIAASLITQYAEIEGSSASSAANPATRSLLGRLRGAR